MTFTIGIDGYNLALPTGTGIATYARTLAATVNRLGWQSMGLFSMDVGSNVALQEILFFERLLNPAVRKLPLHRRLLSRLKGIPHLIEVPRGTVDTRPIAERLPEFDRLVSGRGLFDAAFRNFRKSGKIATLTIQDPPDVMHWTCPIPLKVSGARNIYTVHDLVPLRMPYMTLDNKCFHHALITACVAEADHLCTVSSASAEELIELFPSAQGKVTTTYQTCDVADILDLPERESRNIVTNFGLIPDGYFLYYGALEPKKNVARLIEAHSRLGSETPLVIITGRSWCSPTERHLLDSLSKKGGPLVVLDYLPRGMLRAIISHARAVTFPSIHEGFGLPVLEAMQLGAPVLTGNSGGIIEVAGEGALLVDPYDVSAIRAGLAALDQDPQIRRDLSMRGRKQAARFSAEEYAATMSAVYGAVMGAK